MERWKHGRITKRLVRGTDEHRRYIDRLNEAHDMNENTARGKDVRVDRRIDWKTERPINWEINRQTGRHIEKKLNRLTDI